MEEEMAVELPEDAEGREVPLDTGTLYDGDGNECEVQYYKYPVRRDGPPRGWQAVATDYIVHDVSDLHLTPPDSWERLLGDLKAAEGCGDSPELGDPVCAYARNAGGCCAGCKLYEGDCTANMWRDIASRIDRLRGVGR